jgi:lysophospholipase L1-like esterase
MYNKLVNDFNPNDKTALISQEIIHQLTTTRCMPKSNYGTISDRKIHYQNNYNNHLNIVIFEGGHEMLTEVALNHIPSKTILTIGDSNGANANGWVYQLAKLQTEHIFINTSISGNTVGFDNKGYEIKNSIKTVEKHLTTYDSGKNKIDQILIMLGTNDTKKVFENRIKEVPGNYETLLTKIKDYYYPADPPEIIIISPPPIADDSVLKEKYHGGAKRIAYLAKEFEKIAKKQRLQYIDIYTQLQPLAPLLLRDGIHFNDQGYQLLGFLLDFELNTNMIQQSSNL